MAERVIIVNEKDEEIGLEDKIKAHLGEGILHRAIAIFLFNTKGELLITKRSAKKMLWPGFWDASCCTHPRKGESYIEAGERRLPEELGISCSLEYLTKFQYQDKYKDIGSENEMCALLEGHCKEDIKINPNPDEVADFRWISIEELKGEILENADKFTPWLKIALKEYIKLRGEYEQF